MRSIGIRRLGIAGILVMLSCSIIVFIDSCNQSNFNKPYSPTSSASDTGSTGVAGKKSTKSNTEVSPLIPYYKEGAHWYASYWLFNKYLPEDSAKGKYLVLVGTPPNSDYALMYNTYYFRRAVDGAGQISALTSAGFKPDQIFVQIGWHTDNPYPDQNTYVMYNNWQSVVAQC